VRPFRPKRAGKRPPRETDGGDGRTAREAKRRRLERRRERELEGDSVEQLKATLRAHAREAERRRENWEHELVELKELLRRRVAEVSAREQELAEAVRRLEKRRDGRGRGSRGKRPSGETTGQATELERRARELDALAESLEKRERELELREQRLAPVRRKPT
jgi:hypothetical protein